MSIETVTISSVLKWLWGAVGAAVAVLCSLLAVIGNNFNSRLKSQEDKIINHETAIAILEGKESVTKDQVREIFREESEHITESLSRIETLLYETGKSITEFKSKFAVIDALRERDK